MLTAYKIILIIVLIAGLVYDILVAQEARSIAQIKGHNSEYFDYFWITFLCPVIGLLVVAALPDNRLVQKTGTKPDSGQPAHKPALNYGQQKNNVKTFTDAKWQCPICKENNPTSSRTCRGCGYQR